MSHKSPTTELDKPLYPENLHTEVDAHRRQVVMDHCPLRKNLVDNCFKSRFLLMTLEYFFLSSSVDPTRKCKCPMLRCREPFPNATDMIKHLKDCERFKEGEIWCPACKKHEKFITTEKRECSWDKESFSHKVARVFTRRRSSLKSQAGAVSASRPSTPTPLHNETRLISEPRESEWPSRLGIESTSGPQEIPDSPHRQELPAFHPNQEQPVYSSTTPHPGNQQRYEFDGHSYIHSDLRSPLDAATTPRLVSVAPNRDWKRSPFFETVSRMSSCVELPQVSHPKLGPDRHSVSDASVMRSVLGHSNPAPLGSGSQSPSPEDLSLVSPMTSLYDDSSRSYWMNQDQYGLGNASEQLFREQDLTSSPVMVESPHQLEPGHSLGSLSRLIQPELSELPGSGYESSLSHVLEFQLIRPGPTVPSSLSLQIHGSPPQPAVKTLEGESSERPRKQLPIQRRHCRRLKARQWSGSSSSTLGGSASDSILVVGPNSPLPSGEEEPKLGGGHADTTITDHAIVSNSPEMTNGDFKCPDPHCFYLPKESSRDPQSNLYRHLKRMHRDKAERHSCNLCGKSYGRPDNLQKHERDKHSGIHDVAKAKRAADELEDEDGPTWIKRHRHDFIRPCQILLGSCS